jgi:hypothetical protein
MPKPNKPPTKLKTFTDDTLFEGAKYPFSVAVMKVLRDNGKKVGFLPHYKQEDAIGINFYRYTRCIRGQTAIYANEIQSIVDARVNPSRYTLYDYVTKAAMLLHLVTKDPRYSYRDYAKKQFYGAGEGVYMYGNTRTHHHHRADVIKAAKFPLSVAIMEIIICASNEKTKDYASLFPKVLKIHNATRCASILGKRCVFSDILKFIKSDFNIGGLTFYDVVKKAFDIVYQATNDPNYAPRRTNP